MAINDNIRPYIVLNGVSSRQVKGLLICALPPISKPAQRIKTETVDGRDGDRVTTLGYSAYDKKVSIGLTYEYNVDDIIDFFNSSGKVVFSNEPDLYYKYSVYKQIDFNRLIRFKKADVVFHVQPFKYSDTESEKTFSLEPLSPSEVAIRNNGNFYSRPTITITGSGDINLFINGYQVLTLDLAVTSQTIILDGDSMNALSLDGTFLNRRVSGDLDDMRLKPGKNIISYTGSISEMKIDNYSRWI